MRTPTLQPVPESLPADHVSNSNKKKVRKMKSIEITKRNKWHRVKILVLRTHRNEK